jgi:glycosyltransferase involved in cell wall biosynthesis
MYAGTALPPGYALHIADPPSLLGRDVTKHSFSLRRYYPDQQQNSTWRQSLRGQWVYRKTRIGVQKAGCSITMTERNVVELTTAFGRYFNRLPPGVRIPDSPVCRRPSEHVRFLSVCRLESSKRIDSILHAISKLPNGGQRLTIAGDGSERQRLEQLAKELGVAPRVRFTGEVSEDELESLYAQHDVFLMPAIQGYGLPGLEALVRGLSLVVHRDSGVTEFLVGLPQVKIIGDSDQSLIEAMGKAFSSTADISAEVPQVPTSNEWARRIAEFSGWLQDGNPPPTNRRKTSEQC